MQRVIKFRAWDRRKKRWVEPTTFAFASSGTLGIRGMGTNWYELSQWTGLTDKNGKEIYEGDVVKLNLTTHQLPFVVKFRTDVPTFEFNEPTSNWWERLIANHVYGYEIIGDIYENPELMRQ